MVAAANMVEVAALVGDTARATILAALMGGQALTSSELAFLARISRATASEHLSKLVQARLITVTKKRRYRYYRRLAAGCKNARKHQGGRRHRGPYPPSAALRAGRGLAVRPHLLRSLGGTTRGRDRGCNGRGWIRRSFRRWR